MTKYVGLFEIKLTPKTKKWSKNAWCFISRADDPLNISATIQTAEAFARHHASCSPERFLYVEVEV